MIMVCGLGGLLNLWNKKEENCERVVQNQQPISINGSGDMQLAKASEEEQDTGTPSSVNAIAIKELSKEFSALEIQGPKRKKGYGKAIYTPEKKACFEHNCQLLAVCIRIESGDVFTSRLKEIEETVEYAKIPCVYVLGKDCVKMAIIFHLFSETCKKTHIIDISEEKGSFFIENKKFTDIKGIIQEYAPNGRSLFAVEEFRDVFIQNGNFQKNREAAMKDLFGGVGTAFFPSENEMNALTLGIADSKQRRIFHNPSLPQ